MPTDVPLGIIQVFSGFPFAFVEYTSGVSGEMRIKRVLTVERRNPSDIAAF